MEKLDLVEETVDVGGRELSLLRPRDAVALLDEAAFEREEFLPYWAELWASGETLAREISARDVAGQRLLELGCGLALPSLAAALGGAEVLATDWSPDAIALLEANAERNGIRLETQVVAWSRADVLVARAPWDIVLAADVLYERRNVDELLALLPRLAPTEVLMADPGRPHAQSFFEQATARWDFEWRQPVTSLRLRAASARG
ncbi:MAG: class I SAM-dependent methyltransferase [Gaiellaceae bacterium]